MIIGTGTDIVRIERFKNMREKTRFMKRVFSVREQEYLATRGIQSMAGIFAAKESVAKCLGTGFRRFFPCDIEIMHDKNGRPHVILHGRAKATANALASKKDSQGRPSSYSIHISISHNQTDAIAFAVFSTR